MIVVHWLVVVVLAGCYRPAPQEGTPCSTLGECPMPLHCFSGVCRAEPSDASAGDDAPPGDGPIDAPIDAPIDTPIDTPTGVCSTPPTAAWSAGVLIPGLSVMNTLDGTPEMRSDLLELYFKSSRNGAPHIWRSTRPNLTGMWTAPMLVAELTSNFMDGSPALSPDGLTIYIASNRTGSMGAMDFFKSTRTSLTAAWSPPVRVAELSSTADEEGLTIQPSDRVAYFHSNRGGPYHLYRTTRASSADPWGAPTEITDITSGDYENPWVSPDDCRIYVQAFRNGTGGAGDLYVVSRATPTGAWGAPFKLTPPSTADYDVDPWLTPDERIMLFGTGGATQANIDIYISNR